MIVASIDIGTNTVLLLISEVGKDLSLKPLLNEYRIPRIGKGLLPGQNLTREKIDELISVLEEYHTLITKHKCEKVVITATNSFRIAANAGEIKHKIEMKFDWPVNIVSGEDEARLSYLGAISGIKDPGETLAIDIGGGSTELTFGSADKINFRKSFHIGVVSASEKYFKNDPPLKEEIDIFKDDLDNIFLELRKLKYAPETVIALAGTPTTLASMNQNLTEYDEDKIEGSILKKSDIIDITDYLSTHNIKDIKEQYKSIVKGREDLILSGSIILLKIIELLNLDKIIVSTKGIRYGAAVQEVIRIS